MSPPARNMLPSSLARPHPRGDHRVGPIPSHATFRAPLSGRRGHPRAAPAGPVLGPRLLVSCVNVKAVLPEVPAGRDSTGQVSANASVWQEARGTVTHPGFRRQLGTSCSPFPLKTKQGKRGLNCSKGDLGQIEEKPAGATGTGTLGADGISFPGDLGERGL